MGKKKLTGWIPANTPPVREGWYQRSYGSCELDSAPDYWDGSQWFVGSGGPAQLTPPPLLSTRVLPWRGLASDPKAKP